MPPPKDPQKYLEMQAKMSKTRKGMPSPNKGKKFSAEWRENLSKAHKGFKQKPESIAKMRIHQLGAKSHFWKGGIHDITKRTRILRELRRNGSFYTFGEWETLKAQYYWTCPSCLKQEPEIKLTADHIIPVSKGGGGNIENIQPLCQPCNSRKHDKIIKF